jgi:predicted secreted Zn-dependent protease
LALAHENGGFVTTIKRSVSLAVAAALLCGLLIMPTVASDGWKPVEEASLFKAVQGVIEKAKKYAEKVQKEVLDKYK